MLILNQESIMNEVMLFAKWQMAGILKIPQSAVTASWILDKDGKVKPKFEVDGDLAQGVDAIDIREVISTVYRDVKSTLSAWMVSNRECRDGSKEGRVEADTGKVKKEDHQEKGLQEKGALERRIDQLTEASREEESWD